MILIFHRTFIYYWYYTEKIWLKEVNDWLIDWWLTPSLAIISAISWDEHILLTFDRSKQSVVLKKSRVFYLYFLIFLMLLRLICLGMLSLSPKLFYFKLSQFFWHNTKHRSSYRNKLKGLHSHTHMLVEDSDFSKHCHPHPTPTLTPNVQFALSVWNASLIKMN